MTDPVGSEEGQDEPRSDEAPAVTYGGAALLLQYSHLRSSIIVGRALADTFHTEAAWLAAINEPELQEALSSFGQLLDEIRLETYGDPSPELLLKIGEQHYGRALECIEAFATRIGVSPQDLLLVSL